ASSEVKPLKDQLADIQKRSNRQLVDAALASLQLLISKPSAMFDPYAAVAALEHLVDSAREAGDTRANRFKNHPSCKHFTEFIGNTLKQRVESGAVKLLGKVGEIEAPHIVLPITIEPSKPRLCIDARYLNLWMKDTPFSLDKLSEVPRFLYQNSFMSKIDDKSGYDHVLLSENSTRYFGIEWDGHWWICLTLPFGWKCSPYVYQTLGLVATIFFRKKGIACSLYIDDRLNGEVFAEEGRWSRPMTQRDSEFSYEAATAALYVVLRILTHLGYYLGLKKCVLVPVQRLVFLGLWVDSKLLAFEIPRDKKERFAILRESILGRSTGICVQSLQSLMGKCISFSLAFPGANFYIREMANAIGRATTDGEIRWSTGLREEIEFWKFLDSWDQHVQWRSERHWAISISTDASLARWAGVIHLKSGDRVLGDFLEADIAGESINVKEMWAVAKVLESLPPAIHDCRLDVQPLPYTLRFYVPAVSCPQCQYPNDESFRFCQRCGYNRQSVPVRTASVLKVPVDIAKIEARKEELREKGSISAYAKQKSGLEKELRDFLASLSPAKDMVSASPSDVVSFLIWKDNFGKTVIHRDECHLLGEKKGRGASAQKG
ncbi:hypothetical protein AC249_AIPGENE24378, partial [Exaiptasia diaphana]